MPRPRAGKLGLQYILESFGGELKGKERCYVAKDYRELVYWRGGLGCVAPGMRRPVRHLTAAGQASNETTSKTEQGGVGKAKSPAASQTVFA